MNCVGSLLLKSTLQLALTVIPRLHGEAGIHRVGGKLLAASDDDVLHSFVTPAGTVSEVGERIMQLVNGHRTVSEIVAVVRSEFEVEQSVCERDTLEFLDVLIQKHLVVL